MTVSSAFSIPDGGLDLLKGRLPAVLAFIEDNGAINHSTLGRALMPGEDSAGRTLTDILQGNGENAFIAPVLTTLGRGLEACIIASFTCEGKDYAAELHLCPWHPATGHTGGCFLVLSEYWAHKDGPGFGLPWQRANFRRPRKAILVLDEKRKILAANKQAAEILGPPPEELSGQKARKFLSLESGADGADSDDLRVTLASSKGLGDGIECRATRLPMAGKNCVCVLMWRADEAELSLQSLLRRAAVVETMAEPMFITEIDGTIVEVNKIAAEILNRPPSRLIGRNALLVGDQAGSKKNLARRQNKLAEVIARDGMSTKTDSIKHAEKGKLFFETMVTPFRDAITGRDMYLWVGRDVTQRRQAQQELRRQALIIEQMADAVFILDLEGGILECNPAAARLCGQSKEKTLNRRLSRILQIDDPQFRHGGQIIEVLHKGEFWVGELAYVSAENGPGFLDTKLMQMIDWATGKEIGIICLARDITERKETEEQLRDREEMLTCRVADLEDARSRLQHQSNELASLAEDLHHAREEAEHANRMKSQFLAVMSHEIRTPMNGIMGMAQLLKDSGLSSQQEEYATALVNSAGSLLTLVNDILDISKLEAGALELEKLEFDLCEAVEGAAEILAVQAGQKALTMVLYMDPAIPRLLVGDPARLRQMLLNLVGNALKFTEAGAITLEVSGIGQSEDSVQLEFHIRDTGAGIKKASLGRLFKNYSQAEVSTTRTYGGTGLGLAICKELAAAMKGEIGVDSIYGEGSDFHFSIWLEMAEQQPDQAAGLESLSQRHAAVIDPVPLAAGVLARQMAAWGLKVETFSTLESAFPALFGKKGRQPDYLIVSKNTLDGEGSTLWQKILARPAGDRPRTILLKPYMDMGEDADRGADTTVRQPVKPSLLLARLMQDDASRSSKGEDKRPEDIPPAAAPEPARGVAEAAGQTAGVSGGEAEAGFKALKILVAEDNEVSQMLVGVMLSKAGHDATFVSDGVAAVREVQAGSFDVVLMDVQMPKLDGVSALAEIRKLGGEFESLPIIALTANAMAGDRENYLKAGMNGYVPKPIQWPALEAEIWRLTGCGARATSDRPGASLYDRISSGKTGKGPDPAKEEELKDLLKRLPGA